MCLSTKHHRYLSLLEGLCGRDPAFLAVMEKYLQMFSADVSQQVDILLAAISCHLLPFFVPISLHFLLMNFLLLCCLSHLLPRSLDSDLALSLLCSCNLARRPPVLFQIFCQNSLLGNIFSTLPQ